MHAAQEKQIKLQRALQQWRGQLHVHRERDRASSLFQSRVQLRRHFSCWRARLTQKREEQRQRAGAQLLLQRRKLRRILSTWRARAVMMRRQRDRGVAPQVTKDTVVGLADVPPFLEQKDGGQMERAALQEMERAALRGTEQAALRGTERAALRGTERAASQAARSKAVVSGDDAIEMAKPVSMHMGDLTEHEADSTVTAPAPPPAQVPQAAAYSGRVSLVHPSRDPAVLEALRLEGQRLRLARAWAAWTRAHQTQRRLRTTFTEVAAARTKAQLLACWRRWRQHWQARDQRHDTGSDGQPLQQTKAQLVRPVPLPPPSAAAERAGAASASAAERQRLRRRLQQRLASSPAPLTPERASQMSSAASVSSEQSRLTRPKRRTLEQNYMQTKVARRRQALERALSRWRTLARARQFVRMEEESRRWLARYAGRERVVRVFSFLIF